ncbi:MAG: DNA-binding protein [Gammaproteobacteria bacterium]
MARPGVTYQDISSAANELKGQGKSVTIENVRAILGTGSIGTINNHLRKWKETQSSTHKIASKENLPEELISLVKGLWEGIVTQSITRFEPIEENYHKEIAELKEELEKYKNNNQRWQKLFNQWQQEKSQLASENLTLEQALEFSHKENATLNTKQEGLLQQLQEKQARIDELSRLLKQVQQNLEHYRESSREQRLLDQHQYEQQKQQLQLEIKALNEQLLIQREKFAAFQQQYQSLQQSNAVLESTYAEEQSKHHLIRTKYEEAERDKNEYFQSTQYWQNQFKEIQKSLDNKISEYIGIQTEVKVLSLQLVDLKKLLSVAQDQNKFLANEKWSLAQEKSQLEGQLKQMQKMISV